MESEPLAKRLLKRAYARFGRVRTVVVLSSTGVMLFGVALFLAGFQIWFVPELRTIEHATGHDFEHIIRRAYWLTVVRSMTLEVIALRLLWVWVVRPMESLRHRLRTRVATNTPQEMAVMSYWYERRSRQLDAAIEDNQSMRERLDQIESRQHQQGAVNAALFDVVTDPLIITDLQGTILHLTSTAADALAWRRGDAVGKPFDEVVALFDSSKERPREYPIRGLCAKVIEANTNVPRVEDLLLVDRQGREIAAVLTLELMRDGAGAPAGVIARLTAGNAAPARRERSAASEGDALTGLADRAAFERRIDELLGSARQGGTEHALLLVRLANLAHIGEMWGWLAQDEVIWRAAQLMHEQAPAGEWFRLAHEYFAVLLPLTTPEDARTTARKLTLALESHDFATAGHHFRVTARASVQMVDAQCASRKRLLDDALSQLRRTDQAGGREAAAAGFEAQKVSESRDDRQWVDWVDARLSDGRVHLISQVFAPLGGQGDRPCFETLLRVEDDDGIWITPGMFLGALERMGATSRMDLWAVEAVLAHLSEHPDILQEYHLATINLSASSLEQPDFGTSVLEKILGGAIPGSRLCFEIDEDTVVSRPASVQRFAEAVRGTNSQIALDRFTGRADLAGLRKLGVGMVKLHDGLLQQSAGDEIARARLEWVLRSCQLLGARTVATRVETPEQLERMRAMGVDYAQGVAVNKLGPLVV